MARACRLVLLALGIAYGLALLLFLAGTFGWFGSPEGPLAGVFLVPLGLPRNRLVDWFPEALWPWLAAAAPIINLGLLRFLCSRLHATGASQEF